MTMEWDAGPNSTIAAIFEQAPLDAYVNGPHRFRLEWGPIYYRGRLDGSARVLVIGQDPAADEMSLAGFWSAMPASARKVS
jgi:hypothetical protein